MAGIAATVRDGVRELRRPGENRLPGRDLVRLGRLEISCTIAVTNLIGACAVFAIANFVVPTPPLEDRPATAEEVRIIVRAPLRLFVIQVALWFAAAAVFGVINASFSTPWPSGCRPATRSSSPSGRRSCSTPGAGHLELVERTGVQLKGKSETVALYAPKG